MIRGGSPITREEYAVGCALPDYATQLRQMLADPEQVAAMTEIELDAARDWLSSLEREARDAAE